MRKIGLLALSATLLMSGVAVAAEKQTIKYWSRHGSSDVIVLQKMTDVFDAANPDIEMKLQFLTWGGAYYGKIRASILSGEPPEIFDVAAYAPPMFYGNVESFSAEELVQEAGIKLSDFVPSAWEAIKYKGRYYGTVNAILPLGFYYNTDMFKKAGLDPNKPPTNLKEFLEYAKKLTVDTDGDGKIDQWGFMIHNGFVPTPWVWESILVQNGASLLNSDLTKANFNNKAGLDALNLMLDFNRKYKIAPTTLADTTTAFAAQKVAMMINGSWVAPGLAGKLNFSTAPMPQLGTQKPAAWASLDIYFYPKGSRNNKKKWKDTMTFAKWVAGPEGQDHYARTYLPSRLSTLNSPVVTKDPYMAGFARAVAAGEIYFPQQHKAVQEVVAAVWGNLQDAFAGKITAEKALSQAEEQTNAILAR